jgi:hypothetical protein
MKQIKLIKSLTECIELSDFYDKVIFDISYGREFPFFHYTTIGFANLVAVFMGFLSLKQSINKDITCIPFYNNRVFFVHGNIKYWYLRSTFGTESPSKIFWRNLLKNKNKNILETYIDLKVKTLHLSTHLINIDNDYLNLIQKNLFKINSTELLLYGIILPEKKKKSSSPKIVVGVHIRRGDFKVSESEKLEGPNSSPSLKSSLSILHILLNFKALNISRVEFFSDSNLDLGYLSNLYGKDINFIVHSSFDTGMETLNKMISNDILIHTNSTLSTWASIISGQIAIFPGVSAVYNSDKIFSDKFISFSELPHKLEKIASMLER